MVELPRERNGTENFWVDTLDDRVKEFSIAPVEPRPEPQPLNNPDVLEPYSRAFHDALVRAHPEWKSLGRILPTDNGYILSFFMELPSPSTRIGKLWISTGQGVVIGFGELYHTHFYTYEPETDSTVFDRAIRFVDDFIQERLVLVIGLHGERRGGSWVRTPDDAEIVPEWFAPSAKYDGLHVLSWKCTFDRVRPLTTH